MLVSACLLGMATAYDGRRKAVPPALARAIAEGRVVVVPVCPEQFGGLSTPRPPAEIAGGDGDDVLDGHAVVRRVDGADVTAAFVRGAEEALRFAKHFMPVCAVLKEKSPSCGATAIFDGTHAGVLRPGRGVTAALLARAGIALFTEETVDRAPALA